ERYISVLAASFISLLTLLPKTKEDPTPSSKKEFLLPKLQVNWDGMFMGGFESTILGDIPNPHWKLSLKLICIIIGFPTFIEVTKPLPPPSTDE
ncbi:MAG: hypothetical protein KAG14_02100, partial [Mycoplasmataceae bacterium]|nr:hypothetical protein [Mycoplasmataceae bacterium]